MTATPRKHEPGAGTPPMSDEADIGSGEKTPAQLETEKMIREIPPLPPAGDGSAPTGRNERPA
jgi:hypothetical protein